jgi:hypothetical protein
MKMVHVECFACGKQDEALLRGSDPFTQCACGGVRRQIAERDVREKRANAVHGDDIPGGMTFKHGICHEDGTPRTFYTRREIREATRKAGLLSMEETGQQIPVKDAEVDQMLSRPGYRQVPRVMATPSALNPEEEAARVRHWQESEARLQRELGKEPTELPFIVTEIYASTALLRKLDK